MDIEKRCKTEKQKRDNAKSYYEKHKHDVEFSAKRKAYAKEYQRKNQVQIRERRREKRRDSRLRKEYINFSSQAYEKMYEKQDGRCAICHKKFVRLYVDHNHRTGIIRGLLCRNCNLGLGHFFDNHIALETAILYLDDWKTY